MKQLRPSELIAILKELQKQILIEQYNEQRNRWAFLAAVITNGVAVLSSTLVAVFGGKRRKPKLVDADDFMGKEIKKTIKQLLGENEEKKDWSKHIEEAKAKGLQYPIKTS